MGDGQGSRRIGDIIIRAGGPGRGQGVGPGGRGGGSKGVDHGRILEHVATQPPGVTNIERGIRLPGWPVGADRRDGQRLLAHLDRLIHRGGRVVVVRIRHPGAHRHRTGSGQGKNPVADRGGPAHHHAKGRSEAGRNTTDVGFEVNRSIPVGQGWQRTQVERDVIAGFVDHQGL